MGLRRQRFVCKSTLPVCCTLCYIIYLFCLVATKCNWLRIPLSRIRGNTECRALSTGWLGKSPYSRSGVFSCPRSSRNVFSSLFVLNRGGRARARSCARVVVDCDNLRRSFVLFTPGEWSCPWQWQQQAPKHCVEQSARRASALVLCLLQCEPTNEKIEFESALVFCCCCYWSEDDEVLSWN